MTHPNRNGMTRRVLVRRGLATGMGLSLGGVLAGCGAENGSEARLAPADPPSRPTGMLLIGNAAEPLHLDPAHSGTIADQGIFMRNVYDGLANFSLDGRSVVPGLATEWTASEDAREWTFMLREGVSFHDGEPFDAEAVAPSYEHMRDVQGFAAPLIPADLEIDDREPGRVRFTSKTPMPDFARNQAQLRIYSPKLLAEGKDAPNRTPVGSGPYQFVEYQRGRAVVLEAFPDFYAAGPYMQRIEYRIIPEEAARVQALRSGQLDMLFKVSPQPLSTLEQAAGLQTSSKGSWTFKTVIIRTRQEPTSDLRVRQAIAHAIDRNAIVENVLLGQGNVVDSIMTPGVYGYAEIETAYPYDPERARTLLAEAGEPNPRLTACATPVHVLAEPTAQAVAGQLREVGFDVDLEVVEGGIYTQEIFKAGTSKYDLFIGENGWVNGGPLFFTLDFYNTVSQLEPGNRIDELANAADALADGPEREQTLADVQEEFARELPALNLCQLIVTDVYKDRVRNYVTATDGFYPYLGEVFLADADDAGNT